MAGRLNRRRQNLCSGGGTTLVRVSVLEGADFWICPHCDRILKLRLQSKSEVAQNSVPSISKSDHFV